jgi:hypothetical protein
MLVLGIRRLALAPVATHADGQTNPRVGDLRMAIHNPTLFGIGLAVLVVGIWMWRWAGRNSVNLTGAALSTAMASARSGKMPAVPDDLKGHFDKVAGAKSHTDRAKAVGGTVARHFMAKVVGMAGMIGVVAGLAMAAAGIFWK